MLGATQVEYHPASAPRVRGGFQAVRVLGHPGNGGGAPRGYTKPEYARRRAAALGAGRWTMRAQGEVDKDGVARCLKPLRRNFLNAMFQGGFIEPEFLNVLTEAQFSGRI